MVFICRIHCGRLYVVTFIGDDGSYQFTMIRSEKLVFNALAGIMGEIGLLLAGWDRRTGQTIWGGGEMEGLALAGAG